MLILSLKIVIVKLKLAKLVVDKRRGTYQNVGNVQNRKYKKTQNCTQEREYLQLICKRHDSGDIESPIKIIG